MTAARKSPRESAQTALRRPRVAGAQDGSQDPARHAHCRGEIPAAQARRGAARRDGADTRRACDPGISDEPSGIAAQPAASGAWEIAIAPSALAGPQLVSLTNRNMNQAKARTF